MEQSDGPLSVALATAGSNAWDSAIILESGAKCAVYASRRTNIDQQLKLNDADIACVAALSCSFVVPLIFR
jgi:hypothetical protein